MRGTKWCLVLLLVAFCLSHGVILQNDDAVGEELDQAEQSSSFGWGADAINVAQQAVASVTSVLAAAFGSVTSTVSKITGISSFTGVSSEHQVDTAVERVQSRNSLNASDLVQARDNDSEETTDAPASVTSTTTEDSETSTTTSATQDIDPAAKDDDESPSPAPPPEATCADRVKKKPAYSGSLIEAPNVTFDCSEKSRAPCHKGDTGPAVKCGRDYERCEWEENIEGPYIPCCEKKLLFELFVWFRNLIDANKEDNPDFWYLPIYGTVLAAYRNCDLIDHDTDIDIVVPIEHIDWLDKLLTKHANDVTPPVSWRGAGKTLSRVYVSEVNSLHIDVWYAEKAPKLGENGSITVSAGSHPSEYNSFFNDTFDSSWFHPIDEVGCCFQEECFPCPAKPTLLLDHWFPAGWKTPGRGKFKS